MQLAKMVTKPFDKKKYNDADDLYRKQRLEEHELKRRVAKDYDYRNMSIQGAIATEKAKEKSRNMDNLMDCMGLLERAYNTESLPVSIMDDINVFKRRMTSKER